MFGSLRLFIQMMPGFPRPDEEVGEEGDDEERCETTNSAKGTKEKDEIVTRKGHPQIPRIIAD